MVLSKIKLQSKVLQNKPKNANKLPKILQKLVFTFDRLITEKKIYKLNIIILKVYFNKLINDQKHEFGNKNKTIKIAYVEKNSCLSIDQWLKVIKYEM